MRLLNRLRQRPDGRTIGFPTHIFLYITLVFGISFVLPPTLLDTMYSPLYQFTVANGWHLWWGIGMVSVSALNTLMLLTRNIFLSSFVGAMGFSLWLFACFAYLFGGYVFGFLVGALPNTVFWGWYSVTVARFRSAAELDR